MATDKLTASRVKTAPAGRHFDGGGMYLEVMPTGSRYWRLKYRLHGKEKRLALGVFPEVSLADARAKRDEARAHVREQRDPMEVRRTERVALAVRAANSFEAVAREWIEKRGARWSQTHRGQVLAQFERDVFPKLGPRPVEALSAAEILEVVRFVEARGALDSAGRVLQRIRNALNYAVATGRLISNPGRDLDGALTPPERGHFSALPKSSVKAFMEALAVYPGQPETRIALRLLVLLFVRSGEIRGALWSEFDLEAVSEEGAPMPLWTIPAERMKNRREHLVPLSTQAVALLRELHLLSGHGVFLFPHRTKPKHSMGDSTLMAAVQRIGFGDFTVHGFRALASTELNGMGFRADAIERQLAHVEANKVRAAYHRQDYLDERRVLMQSWADKLDDLSRGEKRRTNVTLLHRSKAG